MPRRFGLLTVVASLVGVSLVALTPETARADIASACGNLDFSGNEMCTVETSGGCMAQCTPVSFEASCAVSLEANCTGSCNASVDVSCEANCSGGCMANCTGHPGMFDCEGTCSADCNGHCMGECMTNGNVSECEASCQASCGARCQANCMGVPPSVDCNAGCTASCKGSCTAQANFGCDIMCTESGYANCEASLMGGCTAQCSQPSGALFCNGQWVNTQSVQDCVNQLKSLFPNIMVQGSASGMCANGMCNGQAQGSVSCDVATPGEPAVPAGLFAGGAGFAALAFVRRRRRNGRR